MRSVATIDVASRDFGTSEFGVVDRHLRAVVRQPPDALDGARPLTVEHHDLTLHIGCRRRHLTVETQIARGFFDDSVRFAGHHVTVVGETDEQPLTTAVKRDEKTIGVVAGRSRDGDRPFERGHRAPEGLHRFGSLGAMRRHQRRNDLGVGGDRMSEAQPVLDTKITVIVDVTVQRRDHVRIG